jgi:(p)ppGpp synthase/HD superfamily hydrolase
MFATQNHLEATAALVARMAHVGQADKAGEPYITHPERVVARIPATEHLDRAVAWLHDVVEDTDVTFDDLRPVFSPTVMLVLDALTHRESETRSDYYDRILQSPIAIRVKTADIADNADPDRLARLDPATRKRLTAKYENARSLLGIGA